MHPQPQVITLAEQLRDMHGARAIRVASERPLDAVRLGAAEDQTTYFGVCRLINDRTLI